MIRTIIDTNCLQDDRLERYLARDRGNVAVITDFVMMEIYKRNALLSVEKATAILRRYSRQTVILRRQDRIVRVGWRSKGLGQRMIDPKQTAAFASFGEFIENAKANGPAQRYVEGGQREAEANMAALLESAKGLPKVFANLSDTFTRDELAELRDRRPRSPSTQKKLLDMMVDQSRGLFVLGDIEDRYWPDTLGNATNTYVFRYALCMTIAYAHWVFDGKPMEKKPEKIVNDIVDVNTAAMATFFDNIMTKDVRVASIHSEARYVLSQIGGYLTTSVR